MWFAALDSYQNNPWLLNLCYRILTGESDVLNLLDTTRLPFDKPPKFLRISRYLYKYTGMIIDKFEINNFDLSYLFFQFLFLRFMERSFMVA
mgnify:CR=1 FL=1